MNVLFLMADELSWWALGHVDARVHTPNIDRLAARARRFTQAYTPCPMCVPARAAVATGRDIHEIGNWSSAEPYDGRIRSWGHALQDAGVTCVSIGKLHYKDAEADVGFDQQLEPLHVVGGVGWVQGLLRRPMGENATPESLAEEIGPGDTQYHGFDRRVTAAAVEWLKALSRKSEPWCAFVSWLSPHYPLKAAPELMALYDAEALASAPEARPNHPILSDVEAYFSHDRYFTAETRGIARAAYFALCTFLDQQVGQVLDTLEAEGLADDTLILFTSDHGEMLGEKGFWTKIVMYDGSAKVPLLMAGPEVAAGDWDHPVSLIDIAPTICGTLGASDAGFSGVDLRAPVAGRVVLSEYHDGGSPVGYTMVRWNRWKLVHYAEGHPAQLFDMAADPEELTDLAAARPEIVAEGMAHITARFDPEAVNARALADQAARIEELGGPEGIKALGQFDYTPVG